MDTINFGLTLGTDSIQEIAICLILDSNEPTESLCKCLNHVKIIVFNLTEHPDEVKYRTLSLTNAKLLSELFCFNGVMEFLSFIGFEKKDEKSLSFVYDPKECNENLEKCLKILKNKVNNFMIPRELVPMPKPSKEVEEKMKEREFVKEERRRLLLEFEADRKCNAELRKMGPDYGKRPETHHVGNFAVNAAGEKVVLPPDAHSQGQANYGSPSSKSKIKTL